jgi:NAD(P)-dependent dehydrogenase (short-subunit alcohol dehydrogenase family)
MSAGRRALVTGASSGLGLACVEALRARSYEVAALDQHPSQSEAEHVAACDVSDAAAVARAVGEAVAALGGLDAVAHCAGVFPDQMVPLHALPEQTWQRTIAVNLTGAFAVARAALPALVESRGALVLTASITANQPQPGASAYAASKAGVAALARAAALEYAHLGVRVNTISPGWMDTPMAAPVLERGALRERVERAVPLARVATPAEVAAAMVWLLSEDACYVTGEDLVIDGGLAASAFVADGDVERAWRRQGPERN